MSKSRSSGDLLEYTIVKYLLEYGLEFHDNKTKEKYEMKKHL